MTAIFGVLAFVGRWGTQVLAASLFVGLLLPPLAALARPLLPVTIFVFVLATFLRVDVGRLRTALAARPGRFGLALAVVGVGPALVCLAATRALPPGTVEAGLLLGLAIQAAAPPIMSSPTIAILLGIEPALVFGVVLCLTILAPITAPVLADLVAGAAIPLDVGILVWRLVILIGMAFVGALVLRRVLGFARIAAHSRVIDGVGVCMYAVFAVAAMDGVAVALGREPLRVLAFLGCAIAVSLAGFGVAALLLRAVPSGERLVLGYATGQRNMGLVIAALGTAAPDTTFLYFALAQFPIYLAPQIVRPIARRLAGTPTAPPP